MSVNGVKSSSVAGHLNHFIGVKVGRVARVQGSNKHRWQIRFGLVFWHVVITFSANLNPVYLPVIGVPLADAWCRVWCRINGAKPFRQVVYSRIGFDGQLEGLRTTSVFAADSDGVVIKEFYSDCGE